MMALQTAIKSTFRRRPYCLLCKEKRTEEETNKTILQLQEQILTLELELHDKEKQLRRIKRPGYVSLLELFDEDFNEEFDQDFDEDLYFPNRQAAIHRNVSSSSTPEPESVLHPPESDAEYYSFALRRCKI